ncbi:MAG: YncE family protein [Ignavibacteriota bacterium]
MFLPRETVRLFLLAVSVAAAQDPGSGLINPQGIAFNSANRKVYAVDQAHGKVTIIDTASPAVRSVQVGAAPVSIAVDSSSGRVYVANSGDGSVSMIDGASDKVLAAVAVGAHPYSIAANPRAGLVYVSHTFSDRTTVIDAATSGVTQLRTGSADLIALDTGTKYRVSAGLRRRNGNGRGGRRPCVPQAAGWAACVGDGDE